MINHDPILKTHLLSLMGFLIVHGPLVMLRTLKVGRRCRMDGLTSNPMERGKWRCEEEG